MKRSTVLVALAALLCGLPGARLGRAAPGEVKLQATEQWAAVFGGKETTLHFTVSSDGAFKGRLTWALTVNARTVERKEQAVACGPGAPARAAVVLTIPPVKPGVVMPVTLNVSVFEEGKDQAAASVQRTLWVYPEDAFFGRKKQLENLKIVVFDPGEKTADTLQKAGVPFESTRNLDALADLKEGTLIVGEGVSFQDYRALPEIMMKAAAKGVRVLCLAASEGEIPIPGTKDCDLPTPGSIHFEGAGVITRLDKKLDAVWPPDGKVVAGALVVNAERRVVAAEIARGEGGWPWMEIAFGEKGGRFVFCGFPVIARWDASPTPRFLLARILIMNDE